MLSTEKCTFLSKCILHSNMAEKEETKKIRGAIISKVEKDIKNK